MESHQGLLASRLFALRLSDVSEAHKRWLRRNLLRWACQAQAPAQVLLLLQYRGTEYGQATSHFRLVLSRRTCVFPPSSYFATFFSCGALVLLELLLLLLLLLLYRGRSPGSGVSCGASSLSDHGGARRERVADVVA